MSWKVWIFVGLLVVGVWAADNVTLAWLPSKSAGVTNYALRFGTNAGAFTFATNSGLVCTQTVALPFRGRWFFGVVAIDSNGVESLPSNVVEWELLPESPRMMGESWVRLYPVIERSADLLTWSNSVGEPTSFPATNAQEYFRSRELKMERVDRAGNLTGEP